MKNMDKKHFEDVQFRTGDIILSKKGAPLRFKAGNGVSMDVCVVKKIFLGMFAVFQSHYSHAGIVVVRNGIPYLLHLTNEPYYDTFTGKHVMGLLSLVSMDDIKLRSDFVYHIPYLGPDINWTDDDLNAMYAKNYKLEGNWLVIFLNQMFNKKRSGKCMCTDFTSDALNRMGIIPHTDKCVDLNYIKQMTENFCYGESVMLMTARHIAMKDYNNYL